jgi:hypothetical protein
MNKGKLKTPEMNLCSHNSGSSSWLHCHYYVCT